MSALRVLMISHMFPGPGRPTVAPFVRRQVKELTALGVYVTVICPVPWLPRRLARGRSPELRVTADVPAAWDLDGVHVVAPRFPKLPGRIDNGVYGPLCYLGVRRTALDLHRQHRFDLIHAQMLIPDGFAAARLGAELEIPSIATERGYLSVLARSAGHRAVIRWTMRQLDQCIFVSRALENLACTIGTPRRPPRVVYTGLDRDAFVPLAQPVARERLSIAPDAQVIGFIGRLEPSKGVLELVNAFASLAGRFPRAHLYLVGPGSLAETLAQTVRSAGLEQRVHFAGVRPHEEMPLWMAAADVIAQPSRNEGLPNALVEASACGCAIVATRVGGIPEVITHEGTGLLVEPRDPTALAGALGRLLSEPATAQCLGQRAREAALATYSWRKHGEQMVAVYEMLARRLTTTA